MSSDALRLHYALFSIVRQVQLSQTVEYNRLFDDAVYVPAIVLLEATGWEPEPFGWRLLEAVGVLIREAMIYDQFTFGDDSLFGSVYPGVSLPDPNGGFIFAPLRLV